MSGAAILVHKRRALLSDFFAQSESLFPRFIDHRGERWRVGLTANCCHKSIWVQLCAESGEPGQTLTFSLSLDCPCNSEPRR